MKRTEKLENVLSEFEKRSVNTGLDVKEDAAVIVAERVQESIHRSCWMLRSRLQLTTKLLNNFRS